MMDRHSLLAVPFACMLWACAPAPEPAASPASPPPAASAAADAPPLAAVDEKLITLEDPGQEPRVPLRLHFKKGQSEALDMVMMLAVKTTVGDNVTDVPEIPMHMPMKALVLDAIGDDEFRLEVTMGKPFVGKENPKLLPTVRQAVDAKLGTMEGTRMIWSVNNRGLATSEMATTYPASIDPEMRRSMEEESNHSLADAVDPFPESPVGKGAVWSQSRNITRSGMSFTRTARYRLVEKQGDALTLAIAIDIGIGKQPLRLPNLPAGVKARIQRGSGSGEGISHANLAKLFATGESNVNLAVLGVVEAKGEKATISIDTSIRMLFVPLTLH